MLSASLLCPLLGGLFRLSALGLPCLLPFSPSVGFSVCAQLLSILIPASSFPGLCPLRSLLLSPRHAYNVVSGLLPVGRFPWLVRCWLLRVPWSPSFSSVSSTGSFGLLDRLPVPVCLSRMLSGFSVLLSLLPLLVFPRSGSSCSPIVWLCYGFSCLFRLLSPNPPSFAWPGCVLCYALPPSLADPFLRTVCSFYWGHFILMAWVLAPSCLSSLLSGFAEWLLPSVLSVCRRWSAFFLGSSLLLPGFILPLALFSFASPCAPQDRSVCAFGFSCFSVGRSPLGL